MRNQGMSFHDKRKEELEMDSLLEEYGFSTAGIPNRPSPTNKANKTQHMREAFDQSRQEYGGRGHANNQYINTTLKMGA